MKRVADDVVLGEGVVLRDFVNLYGCVIGDETSIGPFVEIQKGVVIGRRCKISSHSFICEGVEIDDDVFVGHAVVFTNDRYPRATGTTGRPLGDGEWDLEATRVGKGASVGSGAVVLPGVSIGKGAMIGAGSVVTGDVAARSVVAGNPARFLRASE